MRRNPRRSRRLRPLTWLTATLIVQVLVLILLGLSWPQRIPVELSFVVPRDEVAAWEMMIADFEAEHPNIQIQLVSDEESPYTTDQRREEYRLDFNWTTAQNDLVYMDTVWTPSFADSLVDLTPLIERDGLDISEFLESEIAVGRYGDGLYRLPMRADIGVLYYRKDLIERAGLSLPSTIADLERVVPALTRSPNVEFGYLWQGDAYEGVVTTFVEVLHGVGGQWIDPQERQVNLTSPEALAAAERLRSLLEKEISPAAVTEYTEQSSLEVFAAGRAAFLRGWPGFWSVLQERGLADDVAIALPFSLSEQPSVGCRGGWGFGIPQNAAHPDDAWEVIKYFTSEAAQQKFVLASGFLPSRRSLFQQPDIVAAYPHMPQMLNYLETASVSRPAIPEYSDVSEILQTTLSRILTGEESVEAAMRDAQTRTTQMINSPN